LSAEQSIYAGYQPDVEISPELWVGVRQGLEIARPASQRFRSWLRNVFALPPVSGPVAVGLVVLAVVLTVVVMRYVSSSSNKEISGRANTQDAAQPAPEVPDKTVAVRPDKSETPSTRGSSDKDNATKPTVLTTTGDRRLPSPARSNVFRTKDPRQLVREAEQKYLAAIAMLSRNVDRKKSRLDSATAAELEQALSSIDRTIAATRKVVRQHPDDPVAAQYMLTAYAKKVDVLRELVNY